MHVDALTQLIRVSNSALIDLFLYDQSTLVVHRIRAKVLDGQSVSGIIFHVSTNSDLVFVRENRCTSINTKSSLKLDCGPMPNVMAAMPNIGRALCSTPQSLADAHYERGVQ